MTWYDLFRNWFASLSPVGVLQADSSVASTKVWSRKAPVSVARNRIENHRKSLLPSNRNDAPIQSSYWGTFPIFHIVHEYPSCILWISHFPQIPKAHCSEKISHPTAGALDHHDFRFAREGHTSGWCFSSSTDNFHKSQDSSRSLELNFQPKQQTATKHLQITTEKQRATNNKQDEEQHELKHGVNQIWHPSHLALPPMICVIKVTRFGNLLATVNQCSNLI